MNKISWKIIFVDTFSTTGNSFKNDILQLAKVVMIMSFNYW